MSSWLMNLVDQYGQWAIFAGCMAEGESFAILGGFLAHQGHVDPSQIFAIMASGAFLGDTLFYLAGRFFGANKWVASFKQRPGFDRVFALVKDHPAKFVLLNRYAYGFRVVGGVASGMAGIPLLKFISLNALSSLIWAALFGAIGWFFGLGVEKLIGDAFHAHHRLIIGLAIGAIAAIIAGLVAHNHVKRERSKTDLAKQTLE